MTVTCNGCGRRVDADEVPLGWITSADDDTVRHYCDHCAREHLRAIEARLDPAWW